MKSILRILICPLNWGLGHATRSRPIIEQFIEKGHEVHLGGDGVSMEVLKNYYPKLPIHNLAQLNIQYGSSFWISLLKQLPQLFRWWNMDQKIIGHLYKQYHFDLIISDSRPGCHYHETNNILVISQLSPRLPNQLLTWSAHRLFQSIFKPFNEIWIPDQTKELTLSGQLIVFPFHIPSRRIGFLSKLEKSEGEVSSTIAGRVLAIVSGPEPLRTRFEKDLVEQLKNENALITGGRPYLKYQTSNYISYLDATALKEEINKAEYIICRSGYSTLMDLASYGKKIILVPTPGQSEQIYLANHLQSKKQGIIWDMNKLNWTQIKTRVNQIDPFYLKNDSSLLIKAVSEIEKLLQKKN